MFLPIKIRKLEPEICYIFNGRDFIINSGLPADEYRKALLCCRECDRTAGGKEEGGDAGLPAPAKKSGRTDKKEGNKKKHVEKNKMV